MAVGTAVTVGGILALIGSNLSKVAEGAINIIKIVAAIGFGALFATAIVNLLALVYSATFSSGIVSDIFKVMSMCLPFNAYAVFSAILGSITAILAFLVARRVYMLTMNLIGTSSSNA